MKLELKHLAGYLPYGLKGALSTDCQEDFAELIELVEDEVIFKKNAVWKYSGYADSNLCIPLGEGELDGFLMSNENTYACFSGVCKVLPILRPLLDLTKEIEVNGEKFVPTERFNTIRKWEGSPLAMTEHIIHNVKEDNLPTWIIQKLLEWHFDIYELIKNGLAIDINALDK